MVVVKVPTFTLLAIGLVFSFAFTWSCRTFWEATLGPAFRRLAGVGFGGVHGIGAVHPLGFLRAVDTSVVNWTTRGMQASERGIVYSINQVIDTAGLLFGIPLAIALALYELATWAKHHVGHAVTRVEHTTVIKKVGTTAKVITGVTTVQFNALKARVHTLEHPATHVVKAVAGTIANPFPRIRTAETKIRAQGKRLTRLEKAAFGTLAAGFGVAILAKTLIGWLRCPSVARATKGRRCIDFDFLDSLLTGALLIVGTISLVEFAKEVESVTDEAAGLIHGFLRDA